MYENETLIEIPTANLHPNPRNPRKEAGDVTELAHNMQQLGLLVPLNVKPAPQFGDDHFMIEAGYRRWTAARLIEIPTLTCRVRNLQPNEPDGLMATLIGLSENIHRRDLNPMEKADGIDYLIKTYGMTLTQIAKRTGVNIATVSRYAALLDLNKASQEKVRRRELPVEVAVRAVRDTRKRARIKGGKQPVTIGWEPDHFTSSHALAMKARVMCDARDHTSRRRLGNSKACGECWETVIRADERIVVAAVKTVLEAPFIAGDRKTIMNGTSQ